MCRMVAYTPQHNQSPLATAMWNPVSERLTSKRRPATPHRLIPYPNDK